MLIISCSVHRHFFRIKFAHREPPGVWLYYRLNTKNPHPMSLWSFHSSEFSRLDVCAVIGRSLSLFFFCRGERRPALWSPPQHTELFVMSLSHYGNKAHESKRRLLSLQAPTFSDHFLSEHTHTHTRSLVIISKHNTEDETCSWELS